MRANRKRHVHLGDRLSAIERIREGAAVERVAMEMDVGVDDLIAWQALHAGERLVSLTELRRPQTPEEARLAARVQALSRLISEADRELRELHEEYIRGLPASNEPFEASNEAFDDDSRSSKKFG